MPLLPHRWLPERPGVSAARRTQIVRDYERFATTGWPEDLESYLLTDYGIDVSSQYAGLPLRNPWGKASGQLSMTAGQVAEDVAAGLGFIVLKTVIAEDEHGDRSMQAWAVKEARMLVEPIVSQQGEAGWTVSWKGRGWWHSFEDYLAFVRQARQVAGASGTLIVPSCKYHLPGPAEPDWRTGEYDYTTARLLAAWRAAGATEPMPLEKDFSPTLAGSDRAVQQRQVLNWLTTIPDLVRDGAARAVPGTASRDLVRVGLKLFNALFDDKFQLEMLRTIHAAGPNRPDFFVYGNRLFDPTREFEGARGIAYGGPDLSDRNLRVLGRFQREQAVRRSPLEWSATGNITSGRLAWEYALRGATSFQLHTYFQLPVDQYRMRCGNRTQRALHELYFHPELGFMAWMLHLAERLGIGKGNTIRFRELAGRGPELVSATMK